MDRGWIVDGSWTDRWSASSYAVSGLQQVGHCSDRCVVSLRLKQADHINKAFSKPQKPPPVFTVVRTSWSRPFRDITPTAIGGVSDELLISCCCAIFGEEPQVPSCRVSRKTQNMTSCPVHAPNHKQTRQPGNSSDGCFASSSRSDISTSNAYHPSHDRVFDISNCRSPSLAVLSTGSKSA